MATTACIRVSAQQVDTDGPVEIQQMSPVLLPDYVATTAGGRGQEVAMWFGCSDDQESTDSIVVVSWCWWRRNETRRAAR